jgi:threonine synthase
VAGTRKLITAGVIKKSDRVVAILTGNLLKDPVTSSGKNQPMEIAADIGALAAHLPAS